MILRKMYTIKTFLFYSEVSYFFYFNVSNENFLFLVLIRVMTNFLTKRKIRQLCILFRQICKSGNRSIVCS